MPREVRSLARALSWFAVLVGAFGYLARPDDVPLVALGSVYLLFCVGLVVWLLQRWAVAVRRGAATVTAAVAEFNASHRQAGSWLAAAAAVDGGELRIEWELPRWPAGLSVGPPGGEPTGDPTLDAVCTITGPRLLVHTALTDGRTSAIRSLVEQHGLRVENQRAICRFPTSVGAHLGRLERSLRQRLRQLDAAPRPLSARRLRKTKPPSRRVHAAVALGEEGRPILKEVAHGRHHKPAVRLLAFEALWDAEPVATVRAVQRWWSECDEPAEYQAALELIGRRGGPEFLSGLTVRRYDDGLDEALLDRTIDRIHARAGTELAGAMTLVEEAPGALSLAEDAEIT